MEFVDGKKGDAKLRHFLGDYQSTKTRLPLSGFQVSCRISVV